MTDGKCLSLFVFVVCLSLAACTPTYMNPLQSADSTHAGFAVSAVDHVYIVPVVDLGIQKGSSDNYDEWIHGMAEYYFKHNHYDHTIVPSRASVLGIERQDLEDPTSAMISGLGPSHARWIVLFAVEDASTKVVAGSTGNAEVSLYLFDKERSSLVLRHRGIGKFGQGGLFGIVTRGLVEQTAVQVAACDALEVFPNKKGGDQVASCR